MSIKGRYFDIPIYTQPGRKINDNLRTQPSQLQFGWDDTMGAIFTTEEYADPVKRAVADGCDAIKAESFTFRESGELGGFQDKDRTCMLIPKISVFHRYQLEKRIGFDEKQVCLPPCTSTESAG